MLAAHPCIDTLELEVPAVAGSVSERDPVKSHVIHVFDKEKIRFRLLHLVRHPDALGVLDPDHLAHFAVPRS